MEIEKQVCALEQAKKLKSLGVKQNSIWHYALNNKGEVQEIVFFNPKKNRFSSPISGAWYSDWEKVSAFTVAELGEMLPQFITGEHLHTLHFRACPFDKGEQKNNYEVAYWCAGEIFLYRTSAKTEAEARAQMIIHLLENKIITAEEINAKLI